MFRNGLWAPPLSSLCSKVRSTLSVKHLSVYSASLRRQAETPHGLALKSKVGVLSQVSVKFLRGVRWFCLLTSGSTSPKDLHLCPLHPLMNTFRTKRSGRSKRKHHGGLVQFVIQSYNLKFHCSQTCSPLQESL